MYYDVILLVGRLIHTGVLQTVRVVLRCYVDVVRACHTSTVVLVEGGLCLLLLYLGRCRSSAIGQTAGIRSILLVLVLFVSNYTTQEAYMLHTAQHVFNFNCRLVD